MLGAGVEKEDRMNVLFSLASRFFDSAVGSSRKTIRTITGDRFMGPSLSDGRTCRCPFLSPQLFSYDYSVLYSLGRYFSVRPLSFSQLSSRRTTSMVHGILNYFLFSL